MTKRRAIISACVSIVLICLFILPPIAKVTLRVIDESGKPVNSAQVEMCFHYGCLTKDAIKGVSDSQGAFSHLGWCPDGYVGGGVRKEGYYGSSFGYRFNTKNKMCYTPWDKKITVVLRPIVKPVPMYVRNATFRVPALNKNLGFDLIKAEWLPPYGNGVHEDFIFRVERIYKDKNNFDATLILSFLSPDDGIQAIKDDWGINDHVGSRFRLPRAAPKEGYQGRFVKRVSAGIFGNRAAKDDSNSYVFRVRSEKEGGKLKRAMYGKILGDIRFGPLGDNGAFEMHYYLNPDYTTNLEFDPSRNLFTALPEEEGVGLP